MPNSSGLTKAKVAKKDEFYTQRKDIELEMVKYKSHFEGKVVFCNCDDPETSEFYKFFHENFKSYGLKLLITTHYNPNFTSGAYKLEYDGKKEKKTPLEKDGGFETPECQKILEMKEPMIVVTNPPFSKFGPYMKQLFEFGKDFIIMGNLNAVTQPAIGRRFVSGAMWFGHSIKSGDREFRVPDNYPLQAENSRIDEKTGIKYISVKGIRWFTNLEYDGQYENQIELTEPFSEEHYPKYDHYDAIETVRVRPGGKKEEMIIPKDYYGEMGVPITFLDKFNPDQFEIVNFDFDCKKFEGKTEIKGGRFLMKGTPKYARLIVKRNETGERKFNDPFLLVEHPKLSFGSDFFALVAEFKKKVPLARTGKQFNKQRRTLGMTLEQLAKRIGSRKSTLGDLETGTTKKPNPVLFERIHEEIVRKMALNAIQ